MKRSILKKINRTTCLAITIVLAMSINIQNSSSSDKGKPQKWQKLDKCKLVEHKDNDGDSFHVSHKDKEYIFRLYFVDTIESNLRYYNKDRIKLQGKHYGINNIELALEAAKKAKEFTYEFLSEPFTIHTKWEEIGKEGDTIRYRAYVMKKGLSLIEELVKNGLAQIKSGNSRTKSYRNQTINTQVKKLYTLERRAKRSKKGAWSIANQNNKSKKSTYR